MIRFDKCWINETTRFVFKRAISILMERTFQNRVTKGSTWLINMRAEMVGRIHHASIRYLDQTSLVWNIQIRLHALTFFDLLQIFFLSHWQIYMYSKTICILFTYGPWQDCVENSVADVRVKRGRCNRLTPFHILKTGFKLKSLYHWLPVLHALHIIYICFAYARNTDESFGSKLK